MTMDGKYFGVIHGYSQAGAGRNLLLNFSVGRRIDRVPDAPPRNPVLQPVERLLQTWLPMYVSIVQHKIYRSVHQNGHFNKNRSMNFCIFSFLFHA